MVLERKGVSLWRRLNQPLSERHMTAIGTLGFLAFGLSGLLSMVEGAPFSGERALSLVVGIVMGVHWLGSARRTKSSGGTS